MWLTMTVLVPCMYHCRASSVYFSSVAISARAWNKYELGFELVALMPCMTHTCLVLLLI